MLSILITHYNRPESLVVCLKTIRDLQLDIPYEIVVSDDGSTLENLQKVRALKIDQLITVFINEGLTANLNKGIKACKGDYIFYCQEDFTILPELSQQLQEVFKVLDNGKLDMVRLRANYVFKHLIRITDEIYRIPRFSFKNFNINTFQYSDHPFITKVNFYKKYGYYLEGTSGPYGETEYAIRILNTNAKIGITKIKYAISQKEVKSVMTINNPVKKRKGSKRFWRFARAVRQHFEWLLYSKSSRKLYTYTNNRKQ